MNQTERSPSNEGNLCRRWLVRLFVLLGLGWSCQCSATGLAQSNDLNEEYARRRAHLIEKFLQPGGIKNQKVLAAIAATPRHEFIPQALREQAYFDRALPIGEAQTISSPFIVALMTEVLQLEPTDKVLEIGTGSGYQAAVLSPLVCQVFTIEIVEELATKTTKLLERLGYKNIFTKAGDGFQGWPEHAPFDKIIVTCSPDQPPQPLVDQLKEGGLMVIPVGSRYQQLLRVFRKKGRQLIVEYSRPTFFVPMTGQAESLRNEKVDLEHPEILNGDFEAVTTENYIPGWYYEFNAKLEREATASNRQQFVTFTNDNRSEPAVLLQGLPMDGRHIQKIRLSGYVTTKGVQLRSTWEEQPFIVLQLYDEKRNQIGYHWLGPFVGDLDWRKSEQTFEIPSENREAIVLIGLFGAEGQASFDDVKIEVIERRIPSK